LVGRKFNKKMDIKVELKILDLVMFLKMKINLEWDCLASRRSLLACFGQMGCTWDWICQSDEMCFCQHAHLASPHWGHTCFNSTYTTKPLTTCIIFKRKIKKTNQHKEHNFHASTINYWQLLKTMWTKLRLHHA
jgi:hypothetical protein